MLKYQKAKQEVLEKVYKLKAGQALPPVRTLIKELGYSQVTLKRAFDELEAEGVLKREVGAGIFVAESDANDSCVGVLMPYLIPKMYSQLLAGIQDELNKNELDLLLLPIEHNDYDILYEKIKNNRLLNLIINSSSVDLSNTDFIDFTHKLSENGINIVIIDIPVPGLQADYIGLENTSAFAQLTEKILEQGAKKITVVGKFDSKVYFSRLKGIRDIVNGSNTKLRQIDISDSSIQETALEIAEIKPDALILCDPGSSIDIVYELRIILGPEIDKIKIGGIVEQNERLPLKNAVTLEKQSIEMGKEAVKMLLCKNSKAKVKMLPIKTIN